MKCADCKETITEYCMCSDPEREFYICGGCCEYP